MAHLDEDRVLDLLRERGAIGAGELAELESSMARYGSRLGALIGVGRLDAATVHAAEAETEAEGSELSDPGRQTVVLPTADARPETVPSPDGRPRGRRSGRVCGRYRVAELLGSGGIGEVYRAHDPQLNRDVALKFLTAEFPGLVARFLQEARLQARVEHPNVCKVYEAGEDDGTRYIAMQLIDGRPLSELVLVLSIEEKLKVMEKVSEAVHAAHGLGLIHRDIKPGNVMVERTADGGWHPYVLDFGLAREVEGPGTTTTGQALGSPSYMAPEQAMGRRDLMSVRTDVYGLGAALYHLVAGRPPFDGEGGLAVLLQLLENDPEPLGKVAPAVPEDVRTIVERCMEKEPDRRYESAGAVAEEIRRYLGGEPIRARRSSLLYVARRKARKHRAVVAVSALALLLVSAVTGIALHARWTAAETARLAQEFGRQVSGLRWQLREAYLLPPHDITPVKRQVRESARRIEEQMQALGRVAEGPGHFALGSAAQALGEPGLARHHLEAAWSKGFRTPEVASALGLSLGELYREKLESVGPPGSSSWTGEERARIAAEYGEPAVRRLREGGAQGGLSPEHAEGLIALYEGRHAVALAKAQVAFQRDPGLYEALLLEARARMGLALEHWQGGDEGRSREEYMRAAAVLGDAARYGESDPRVYEATAEVWASVLDLDTYGGGGDLPAHVELTLQACDRAVAVDPERAGGHLQRSNALRHWAQYQMEHGDDGAGSLARAIESAGEAVRLRPDLRAGHLLLGHGLLVQAETVIERGEDARALIEESIASYRKAIEVAPGYPDGHAYLGLAYQDKAGDEMSRGGDALPSLDLSIASFEKASAIDGQDVYNLVNLGSSYLYRGKEEMLVGRDPSATLHKGIECYRRAAVINPQVWLAYSNQALAHYGLGQYAFQHGRNPSDSYSAALDLAGKALEISAETPFPYLAMGQTYIALGEYALASGTSGRAMVQLGLDKLGLVERVNSGDPSLQVQVARAHLVLARIALSGGGSPRAELDRAAERVTAAQRLSPGVPGGHRVRGQVELLRGQWLARSGDRAAESALEAARRSLADAVGTNGRDTEALVDLGEVERRAARLCPRCPREEVRGGIERGLEAVRRALAINPELPRALAEEAALLSEMATVVPEGPERRRTAAQARALLDRALFANPFLRRDYGGLLSEGRRR